MIMVSEKQLAANRENAKKGGVKTQQGKAAVRLNALKHGLLCKDVLLQDEDEDALAELRERLIAELCPQGELEHMLVDRIVSCYWRLGRAIKVETMFIQARLNECGPELYLDEPKAWGKVTNQELHMRKAWLNLNRYETAIERQLYKALHELERRQMARLGAQPTAPIAIDLDVSRQN
jgi:hypothetical protein